MSEFLRAPFPYFGGKSGAASIVWQQLGDVANYVEPFFGSGAVLLQRPHPAQIETINDINGYIVNFWRAIQHDLDAVVQWCNYPVLEIDLHARNDWLKARRDQLVSSLASDPEWFDAKVAGWWVWGACAWIRGGWCESNSRPMPHLADAGRGVHRVALSTQHDRGSTTDTITYNLQKWFAVLSNRLRRVRVLCGDWSRVLSPAITTGIGTTGVFLDPPYASADIDPDVYFLDADYAGLNRDVRAWCVEAGDNPAMRIVLAAYEGDHDELLEHGWRMVRWKARKGYQKVAEDGFHNGHREVLYCSPHCQKARPLEELWSGDTLRDKLDIYN